MQLLMYLRQLAIWKLQVRESKLQVVIWNLQLGESKLHLTPQNLFWWWYGFISSIISYICCRFLSLNHKYLHICIMYHRVYVLTLPVVVCLPNKKRLVIKFIENIAAIAVFSQFTSGRSIKMQNAKCKMQNAKCKMQNAKCKMQNANVGISN